LYVFATRLHFIFSTFISLIKLKTEVMNYYFEKDTDYPFGKAVERITEEL